MIGGGVAGLTLAATLDPRRFEVVVHEAQPDRVSGGAALGVWPSARRALARIGVATPAPAAVSGAALQTLDGRRLIEAPAPPLTLMDRPALMSALAAAVPSSVRHEEALIADPAGLDGELVVGADGVRSQVRGLVSPAAVRRRATPWVALRAVVPGAPDPREVGEYWGPGRLFGITPLAPDRTYWFTSHRSRLGPEPLEVAAVLAEASDVFAGAAPVIGHLLATPGANTLATRLWLAPPMTRYVRGRYVVVGDAAHATLPNLGRGACDAILDAVSLGRTLNRGGSLLGWQARRLPTTQAAHLGARTMMEFATSRRLQPSRDWLLRAITRGGEPVAPTG
ncbi:MAG: FAD-dependent monooxygenase [Propionibacteriales bacterium]|nr:FAD-dependent monooxygenase [Propionibacteriales bacterium]